MTRRVAPIGSVTCCGMVIAGFVVIISSKELSSCLTAPIASPTLKSSWVDRSLVSALLSNSVVSKITLWLESAAFAFCAAAAFDAFLAAFPCFALDICTRLTCAAALSCLAPNGRHCSLSSTKQCLYRSAQDKCLPHTPTCYSTCLIAATHRDTPKPLRIDTPTHRDNKNVSTTKST